MHLRLKLANLPSRIAILMVALGLLTACGTSGSEPSDTAEPTATDAHPTAAPDELSVGQLIDQIDTAWAEVDAFRVTSSSGPVPVNSATAPASQGDATVEEWVAPNDRRIVEYAGGAVMNEQIYVDSVIYMRGLFVGTAVAPEVGNETWIILDQDVVPADTPVGVRVSYLTREPRSPFDGFTDAAPDLANQPVTESGTVRVGDRSCQLYAFGDPDGDGDEMRYEVALDENNLPCQVVQRGGGFQNSSVYEFEAGDIAIEAPLEGTPVSGTPEG